MTLGAALPAAAERVSTTMTVSVQVMARAIVESGDQSLLVTVTEADIARGYVDATEPIVVRVRTNSRSGYMLQAARSGSEAFSTIALSGKTVSLTIKSDETWLQRPYATGGDVLSMRARLFLAAGVAPGTHRVPLTFTASAL